MNNILDKIENICADEKIKNYDVLYQEGKSLSISSQNSKVEKYAVSSSHVVGIRVIEDQKVAISFSEDLSDESLKKMIKSAKNSSHYSERDEYQEIIGSPCVIKDENKKLFQEDQTSLDTKIQTSIRLESEIKKKSKLVVAAPYNRYSDGESKYFYKNSKGVSSTHQEKYFTAMTSALLKEKEVSASYYSSDVARTFLELKIDSIISEAYEKAEILLKAKAIPSGNFSIIFDLDCLAELIGLFSPVFSGKSVKDGVSFYKDKLNENIASSLFTLKDSPMYEKGFNYTSFDDEGTLKNEVTLIENGKLKTFFHNSLTAKFLKAKNTGHAVRSPKGHLGMDLSQMVIEAGKSTESDLYTGKHLRIVELDGLHPGSNLITGNFSCGVKGFAYEGKNLVTPIKDMTISGNFFELIKNIDAIGNEIHQNQSKNFFSPLIRFGGISAAGV